MTLAEFIDALENQRDSYELDLKELQSKYTGTDSETLKLLRELGSFSATERSFLGRAVNDFVALVHNIPNAK